MAVVQLVRACELEFSESMEPSNTWAGSGIKPTTSWEMNMEFLIHIVVTAALLFAVGRLVNGVDVSDPKAALLGALALGVANAIIKPIIVLLTLPVTILTLGLFLFLVNAAMFGLAAAIVPGFKVKGVGPALIGSLLLAGMNWGVSALFGI